MSDVVTAWIDALTSCGVTLQARGKNVGFAPKSAYNGSLTDDERRFYKQHRAEIVAALRRYGGTARPEGGSPGPAPNAVPTAAPAPEPCRWCGRAPCIGESHDAYLDLHPDAAERRDAERLTHEMLHQVRKPNPWP
jgi:hypothetical protein